MPQKSPNKIVDEDTFLNNLISSLNDDPFSQLNIKKIISFMGLVMTVLF